MATEILSDNSDAFCAGSAAATAVNAAIKPMMVPSKPNSVAMLARVARYCVRFSNRGSTSISPSSIAYSTSSRRQLLINRAMPAPSTEAIALSELDAAFMARW